MPNSPLAIVSGAASGIGLACCAKLKQKGYQVLGIDLREPSKENRASMDAFLLGDVSESSLWQSIHNTSASIDLVVNCAAIVCPKPVHLTKETDWDRVLNTNTKSAFLSTKYLLPKLKQSKGCIINMASVHAIATSTDASAYAASKGALVALTRQLAVELGPMGIRVNTIIPGAVDTPMLRERLEEISKETGSKEDPLEVLKAKTVLKKITQPEEISDAVYFIANSKTMTGSTLTIDAGALARLSTE